MSVNKTKEMTAYFERTRNKLNTISALEDEEELEEHSCLVDSVWTRDSIGDVTLMLSASRGEADFLQQNSAHIILYKSVVESRSLFR